MPVPREVKMPRRRIAILIALCIIMCVSATLRTFQFQIVDGESYLAAAQSGTTTTIEIPAARGEIVDRNGIPLAQNQAAFNVTFNFLSMERDSRLSLNNEKTNALIYNLIRTFEALGEEWIDSLPVSLTTPYTFTEDSETEVSRLKKRVGVNDYATAENCIDWIYRECGIKKYRDNDGNCTHCGEPFDECDYEEYSEEYARKIAGVRYSMLAKDFSAYNTQYTFAEGIAAETVALLKELSDEFPGVQIEETSERVYTSGDVAPQLIGTLTPMYDDEYETTYSKKFADEPGKQYERDDLVGRGGVEAAFEDELRRTSGTMTVTQNSDGDIIDIQETSAPIAGKTIQLTLDYNLQKELQTELADYIAWYNATNTRGKVSQNAALVILDAKNGGLLTSISYPYYDINDAIENYEEVQNREGSPLVNRALNGTYRPGSTFKPIVAAAGLTEGLITPSYTFYCDGYHYYYYADSGYTPNCVGTGHKGGANLDATQALHYSCNSFFYDLGRRLGIDMIGEYARYFGLGVDTGLEIYSEIGRISKGTDENWEGGNVIQAAIGQMNTNVTPLQMAVEAMTIANHGTRYSTHLLDAMLDETGNVVSEYETTVASSFDLSDEAYEAIAEGMAMVAGDLTGEYRVTDLGYDVYIKTGTPQVTEDRTHHCFIGYVLKDGEPEIAIAMMVEDGQTCQRFLRRILLAYDKAQYPEKYATEETVENAAA